jgi:hypothetical protein
VFFLLQNFAQNNPKQMAANSKREEKKRGFCHIDFFKILNDITNMTIQTWISVPNKEKFKVSPICP